MTDPLDEAMKVTTLSAAADVLHRIVSRMVASDPKLSYPQAEYIARANIGYYAGRWPDDVRARVEQLFKTAHPIFGALEFNGPPTQEQCFMLGKEFGNLLHEGSRDPHDKLASLPRADCRRVGRSVRTGIHVRAIGLEGKWESMDISNLTCDSLIRWLRSRGGRNSHAEATVLILLGHTVPDYLSTAELNRLADAGHIKPGA